MPKGELSAEEREALEDKRLRVEAEKRSLKRMREELNKRKPDNYYA